ncbi:MAG: ABC transporter permease [Nitrospinota bacterium]
MSVYILRRLLLLIPTLFGVSVVIFLSIRMIPGDPAEALAGELATREYVEEIRRIYGLNEPVHVQYLMYLKRTLRGDFGRSIHTERPVLTEVLTRFRNTLQLAVLSMLLATLLGLGAGILSAAYPYSKLDYGCMSAALVGISMPVFWLGLLLMAFFSVYLGWLPAGGKGTPAHLIMPSFTLGITAMGLIARMTRNTMLEVIHREFVTTARAKGVGERAIQYKHALRNALLPIVTVIGLQSGYLLGGAVVTESVFAWPGLGRYVVEAIRLQDYPAVQGSLIFFALIFMLVNLGVDLLYSVIDPRIRYGGGKK